MASLFPTHSKPSGSLPKDLVNPKDGFEDVVKKQNFVWENVPEPHAARKAAILKKYPQVADLMKPEPLTKWLVLLTVTIQVVTAASVKDWSWWPFLGAAYVIGGTANQSLFLAIHEISHQLGSASLFRNKLYAMIANCPIGIPYSVMFTPFHMDHHREQGTEGVDTDIPTWIEAKFMVDWSFGYVDRTLKKALFMFTQIFFYALRPMFVKPDVVQMVQTKRTADLAMNWAIQLTFNFFVVKYLGWNGYLYFLMSSFFAGSIHPVAGHFIAEHYVFEGKHETYSYYGPLNYLCYNVGYHNEHHDFPNIPWSGLPKLREIAPEFYDVLPQCTSWGNTVLRYIFDDSIQPYSRVKRANPKIDPSKPIQLGDDQ